MFKFTLEILDDVDSLFVKGSKLCREKRSDSFRISIVTAVSKLRIAEILRFVLKFWFSNIDIFFKEDFLVNACGKINELFEMFEASRFKIWSKGKWQDEELFKSIASFFKAFVSKTLATGLFDVNVDCDESFELVRGGSLYFWADNNRGWYSCLVSSNLKRELYYNNLLKESYFKILLFISWRGT